ncbi:aspartate/glutamate racemase family protein [Sandarakinorhabdus oryzae]|uniref:aspartate/glutamate racemase family protein n=1 Tax=Sandarakinorhabdus oryzae TaxID=2675220 RepID=UPI0012E17CDC|nr:aspartate/glutamate racemase family protein [Sandarakinorhabdus oryzae]
MHVGLIGGIGPASQDYYTRQLIGHFARAGVALELTTAHGDAPTLLANLGADRRAEQAAIFVRLAERLARAGSEIVAVTSIAGHFCRAEFAAASPLPVIDMIDVVARDVAARGLRRIGILGTRTVMASGFYGGITTAQVIAPADLDAVHDAYAAMATAGTVTAGQRQVFETAAVHLLAQGTEASLLGGTDLALVFDAATAAFPLIDCAALHAGAIARQALGQA